MPHLQGTFSFKVSTGESRPDIGAIASRHQREHAIAYVKISQLAQSVVCNTFHMPGARLARWLLMTRMRADPDDFHLMHETIARLLAVPRVGVTRAAHEMQPRESIRHKRGVTSILDPRGLRAVLKVSDNAFT